MAKRERGGRAGNHKTAPPSSDPDRVRPHSLEAERAVLGAVLVAPEGFAVASTIVTATDFYRAAHTCIWQAMEQLAQQDTAIDLVTLAGALGESLEDCGGRAYLSTLVDGVPHSTNVPHYAGMVRELAQRRRTIEIAEQLETEAYGDDGSSGEIVERAIDQLSHVVHTGDHGIVTIRDAVDRYVDAVQRGVAGITYETGFIDLDAVIGGLKPRDLVILAARPSVGKSSLGLAIADYIAGNTGPVLYVTLEMTAESLAARLLAWRSRVSSLKLERQTATDTEYFTVGAAAREVDAPLWIESTAKTVTEIAAWGRLAKLRGGLSCIVVDYIQLLVAESRRSNDNGEGEMKAISAALKRLAKELDVVVVAISQLNRAPEGRKDKRPHTSDLRGSGALEQDCDLALLLFREEMYSPTPDNYGIGEVIIAKNRAGPTGCVRLAFTKELAMFGNLARQE